MDQATPKPVPRPSGHFRLSEEWLQALRERVGSQYYDRPEVVEVVARAILISRGIYLN